MTFVTKTQNKHNVNACKQIDMFTIMLCINGNRWGMMKMTTKITDLGARAPDKAIQDDNKNMRMQTFIHHLVDAIPDVFLILNEQRQVVFANDATLQLLGSQDKATLLGQRPGEMLACEHANNDTGGCGTTEACKVCGAFRAINNSLNGSVSIEECRIATEDGDALDFRVWATPLKFRGRDLSVFTLKDISDEKRRRVLEKTFFHDIMNTASIAYTYTEILKMEPDLAMDVADDIHNAMGRLINEINAQRQLMEAESGDLATNVEAFSIADFAYETAHQYDKHQVADMKNIQVEVHDDTLMESDRTLLGRVLGNMVKNALEASEAGDTVTVSYDIKDGYVRFYVNNPTFMPRKVQLQIFRRSFSTKGSGRGIGTYSMRLLSEKYLQGQVSFISTQKEGTTFMATFPLTYVKMNTVALAAD
jgi:signal transduction histidine kinase